MLPQSHQKNQLEYLYLDKKNNSKISPNKIIEGVCPYRWSVEYQSAHIQRLLVCWLKIIN